MCASDYGICYNGEIVGQAVACQLPMMILIDLSMRKIFFNHLFNRCFNNMNLIAKCDIYPELMGGASWFGKIADTLA